MLVGGLAAGVGLSALGLTPIVGLFGYLFVGAQALDIGKDLYLGVSLALAARTQDDIEVAGDLLASGAAKTGVAGVEYAGGKAVAKLAGAATAVIRRKISGPGPNFPTNTRPTGSAGGKPTGKRSTNKANADPDFKRGIELENESADLLAKQGYRVEQNPTVPGAKNPDFRIEGKIFDNYAPNTSNPRSIVDGINRKVGEGQADRIVLNLADSNVERFQLRQALVDWGSRNLREIILIDKTGSIFHFFP